MKMGQARLKNRFVKTTLAAVIGLAGTGCGGPSQETLDRLDNVSTSDVDSIQLPASTLDVPSPGNNGSYTVGLEQQATQRPVMPRSTDSVDSKPSLSAPATAMPAPSFNGPTLSGGGGQASPSLQLPPTLAPPSEVKPTSVGGLNAPSNVQASLKVPANQMPGKLDIGDPAPPLAIGTWAKGKQADGFEPGKVYVVEFWATWCGPCKDNMPHLGKLQQQYGDQVHIIGISDESIAKVQQFISQPAAAGKTWDDLLTYTIAVDDQRATKLRYPMAAGERSIPLAFIVGKTGLVEWIGHPAGMDEPLAAIVAGNWDIGEARIARQQKKQYQVAMKKIGGQMRNWLNRKEYDAAITAVDAVIKEFPTQTNPYGMKLELLRKASRFSETYPVINELSRRNWDNANMLGQLSWMISAETTGDDRDLDLAVRLGDRCVELTGGNSALAMDTLARAHFEKGSITEAVAWQTKAVDSALAANDKYLADMKDSLTKYKAAAP